MISENQNIHALLGPPLHQRQTATIKTTLMTNTVVPPFSELGLSEMSHQLSDEDISALSNADPALQRILRRRTPTRSTTRFHSLREQTLRQLDLCLDSWPEDFDSEACSMSDRCPTPPPAMLSQVHAGTFWNLRALRISQATLTTDMYFWGLKVLRLTDCRAVPATGYPQFKLPRLQVLTASGTFNTVHSLLDYSQLDLRELSLERISDMDVLSGIHSSTLTKFSLVPDHEPASQHRQISTLEHFNLPVLRHFWLYYSPLQTFRDLQFGSLESLDLLSEIQKGAVSPPGLFIENISAPNALSLNLSVHSSLALQGISLPSLEEASISVYNRHGLSDTTLQHIDLGFLSTVQRLNLSNAANLLNYSHQVCDLTLEGALPTQRYNLPALSSLNINDIKGLSSETFLQPENIKSLVVDCPCTLALLKGLPSTFPNLEVFSATHSAPCLTDLFGLSLPHLKSACIPLVNSKGRPASISDCQFPSLNTLIIVSGSKSHHKTVKLSDFSIIAPLLEVIEFRNVDMKQCHIRGFPKLYNFGYDGPLRSLILEDASRLALLTLKNTKHLHDVSSTCPLANLKSLCGIDTPFSKAFRGLQLRTLSRQKAPKFGAKNWNWSAVKASKQIYI